MSARRRAFTFAELMVAGVILLVLLTLIARTVVWSAMARRTTAREQLALQEASNALERLTAETWDNLTPQRVAKWELPENARRELPESELEITLSAEEAKPSAKRLTVLIRWREHTGQPKLQVRLVTWVYRQASSEASKS